MKNSIFDWVATLTLATLLLGILGGTQTGASFSLAPAAALLNRALDVNPHGVSNEPLDSLTRRAGDNLQASVEGAIATAANDQTDPRLAACRAGSVEVGQPIALSRAKTLQQVTVGALIEVQGYLGRGPDCNEQNRWTYLIEGGGVLIATETTNGVQINVK